MTISAANFTFGDFSFRLGNAFCITNNKCFLTSNMVKVHSSVVSFIATINTAMIRFIVPEPLTNFFSSFVGLFINSFSITWFRKPFFAPSLTLYGVIFPVTGLAIRLLNFVWVLFSPFARCFPGFLRVLYAPFCRTVIETHLTRPPISRSMSLISIKIRRRLFLLASNTGIHIHILIIPNILYPCKPDIFEATYEPVED